MNATLKKKNKTNNMLHRIVVFTKAQFSAFVGGLTDYTIMIFFTEIFHVHYTVSIAIGGVIGAIINFSLNKTWTFHTKDIPYQDSFSKQLMKFVLVVTNSIVLKSTGTYLITTFLGVDYKISRLLTDLFVSIAFNYTLQKFWVFKKNKVHEL
jgi:putative flippase GtrA